MTKHFVTFYGPGTFFDESETREIASWNVKLAQVMAKGVKLRYGARPFGFQFSTRTRSEQDFDSRQSKQSPMYYLNGIVETLDDVKRRNSPDEKILRSNMKGNGWHRIVRNDPKSKVKNWAWCKPLNDDDVVL